MEEHYQCGGQFWSPGKSKGVSEGCPNCGRPYRTQPSPTIPDTDMAMKEMPQAAGDGGLNSDMSGNPLKEGILADNGWQNRNKRDEVSGSVNRETFNMEPILPWWVTSAEEHNIEGDAEIESVMPPTPSDSPTVEAKLVDGSPGWHGATTGVADMSLTDLQPPVVIDGEPYSQEMGRQLMAEYMSPDHPSKTFMISHPDPEYLDVLKSVIETGRPEGLRELQEKIINQKSEEHGKEHAVHESVLELPGKERTEGFHDENTNLSRALYATQAHTYGVPYLSGNQKIKSGIAASHAGYKAGDTQIPIATSHPELGEVLQRVSDLDSLDPLFDWLGQHPEITEEQKTALRWLAEQNIADQHEAKTSAPIALNPPVNNWDDMMAYNPFKGSGPMSPEAQKWLKNYMDTNHLVEGPATGTDLQGRPAPQTAPQAPVEPPKPSGGGLFDDIGKGVGNLVDEAKGVVNVADDAAKTVAPFVEDAAKAVPKAVPKALPKILPKALPAVGTVADELLNPEWAGPANEADIMRTRAENEQKKQQYEDQKAKGLNPKKPDYAPVEKPSQQPFEDKSLSNMVEDVATSVAPAVGDAAKGVGGAIGDAATGVKNFLDTSEQRTKNFQRTQPEAPVETKPEQPNNDGLLGDIGKGVAGLGALGLGALGLGGKDSPSTQPRPKTMPQPTNNKTTPTRTRTQGPRPKFKLPSVNPITYEMDPKPPMEYMTHNKNSNPITDAAKLIPNADSSKSKLEMLKNLVTAPVYEMNPLPQHVYMTHVKNAEREDADEHPSSHSEIPANDITNPDQIDPHQKKEDDNKDWQKDFSVNDIGGAKENPGAVVVTVSGDLEPLTVEEIGDMFDLDKDSEPVKLISDFWDHFMDHIDKPEHERDNDDPILSLLKELLGNERDNGSK